MRRLMIACNFILILAGPSPGVAADPQSSTRDERVRTDANIVTAIDVSGSIDVDAERIELVGLTQALVHPAVMHAIHTGAHRRIGFSAFTWSSAGQFVPLIPWRVIGSAGDAEEAAALLVDVYRVPRMDGSKARFHAAHRPWRTGMGTDVSAAIEHALGELSSVPFVSGRRVINICANGRDNIRNGPSIARHRADAAGIVINGLILGEREDVATYFRDHVQTGFGSFVIQAREPEDLIDAMLRKFVMEIAWRPLPTSFRPC
jgi:Ca-activated chloride channel homolog